MSDEVVVCAVILCLTIVMLAIATAYVCCCIAIIKMEEYQKNDEKDGPEKG